MMVMKTNDSYPTLFFDSQTGWEAWLAENGAEAKGVWLKIARKEPGILSVNYAEALESALCYGWIDGQKAALNEQHWLQKFTPRGAKSGWSKINRAKAEALIASGRMQAAGLRQVELARADGRWDMAYESQRTIGIPEDLQAALDQHPDAGAFFATLDSANRYAVLYRVTTAKKPETRAARIIKLVEMLDRKEKIHP
jgi:uncharacterized protein YdeI (YjbR/CyaY-like superfamily)